MNQKSKLSSKLDKKIIHSFLPASVVKLLAEFRVLETVPSTNDEVMERLRKSDKRLVVCVANEQTNGRGRNGKVWQSPPNSNLYMSIGGVFDVSLVSRISGLSLACGVSIARLLEKNGLQVGVKWPNDILIEDKKLAGILVESRIKAKQVNVVIGVGLNVSMPDAVAADIDRPWTDLGREFVSSGLGKSGDGLDRNKLLAYLISALVNCLFEYNKSEFVSFEDDWRRLDALAGREVVIKTEDAEFDAEVLGINGERALRVRVGNEEKVFYAADIKLKLKKLC